MLPSLEYIKTLVNGLKKRINDSENTLKKSIENSENGLKKYIDDATNNIDPKKIKDMYWSETNEAITGTGFDGWAKAVTMMSGPIPKVEFKGKIYENIPEDHASGYWLYYIIGDYTVGFHRGNSIVSFSPSGPSASDLIFYKTETTYNTVPDEYLSENIARIADAQSDWNESNKESSHYIKNKPSVLTGEKIEVTSSGSISESSKNLVLIRTSNSLSQSFYDIVVPLDKYTGIVHSSVLSSNNGAMSKLLYPRGMALLADNVCLNPRQIIRLTLNNGVCTATLDQIRYISMEANVVMEVSQTNNPSSGEFTYTAGSIDIFVLATRYNKYYKGGTKSEDIVCFARTGTDENGTFIEELSNTSEDSNATTGWVRTKKYVVTTDSIPVDGTTIKLNDQGQLTLALSNANGVSF